MGLRAVMLMFMCADLMRRLIGRGRGMMCSFGFGKSGIGGAWWCGRIGPMSDWRKSDETKPILQREGLLGCVFALLLAPREGCFRGPRYGDTEGAEENGVGSLVVPTKPAGLHPLPKAPPQRRTLGTQAPFWDGWCAR